MKIIDILNDNECVNTILSLHTSMYSMMTKIKCIFAKYNIKYTFAHGTLIGQIRNKNLLLWDDDIDYVIENDTLIENTNFLLDCYNIGLSIIITPYEMGYTAKYRITDHKYLKQTPSVEPIVIYKNFKFPDIMADIHDKNYYKHKYAINDLDFNDLEQSYIGPLQITIVKNPMYLIRKFINVNDINDVIITHIHDTMGSKFLLKYINENELPYKLNLTEINAINNFYKQNYYEIMNQTCLEITNFVTKKILIKTV